jgi:hypothetical protein
VSLHHAYILKGFCYGANAPEKVLESVEALIQSPQPPQSISDRKVEPGTVTEASKPEGAESPLEADASSQPVKQKRSWSPEQREAAAERMRARQAAGLMKRKGRADPGEALAPLTPEVNGA